MTTIVTPAAAPVGIDRNSRLRVTQSRVLLSEWTKFRSLRSTITTLR